MSEHSDIMGGSNAQQRTMCPGSYALEMQIPREEKASEHAERGTALHEAMEDFLLNVEPDGGTLDELEGVTYNGWVIDQHLIKAKLKPALAAFKEIIQSMGGDLDFMCEVKASLNKVIPGAFGTIDILGMGADGRLLVLDWKFGDGVKVSPKASYQNGFYAACALYDDDPEIKDMIGDGALSIVFAIVQPREGRTDEADYEIWETTDEWVEDLLDKFVPAYELAQTDNAPLKTGSHCRWCRAKRICPEQQKGVVEAAESVPAKDMDPVTMAAWLERCDVIEDFIKAVRSHAHDELERGVKIPGYKLVPKRAQRKYNDIEEAEAVLRKMRIKVADMMNQTLKTPAQLEKSIPKKKYEIFAKEHVNMVSSGNTLAVDTDTRPDVSDPLTLLAQHTAEQ